MPFELSAIIANVSLLAMCTYLVSFRDIAGTDERLRARARVKGTMLAMVAAALSSVATVDPVGFGVDGRLGMIYAAMLLVGARAALAVAAASGVTAWIVGLSDPVEWLIVTSVFTMLSAVFVWRVEGGPRRAPFLRTWLVFPAMSVLLACLPVMILPAEDGSFTFLAICVVTILALTVLSLMLFRAFMFWGLNSASRMIELEQMRARAEDAARVKTEFLKALSHNLRTPLHGMCGLIELVEGDLDDGPQRVRLRKAEHLGRQLNHMISTGLRFVEVDNVPLVATGARFTLDQMRRKALSEFQAACERHAIALRVECVGPEADADVPLNGYQDVLEEVTVLVLRYFLRGAPPSQIIVNLGLETRQNGKTLVVITGSDALSPLTDAARPVAGLADDAGHAAPEVMDLSLAVAARLAALTNGSLTGLFEPGNGHYFTYKMPVTPVEP